MKTAKRLSSLGLMVLSAGCVSESNVSEVAPGCFQDRYTVAAAKTDILVVKDTSASMANENSKIISGMNAFVQGLPSGVDYRVAVMLADAGKGKAKGKLLKNDHDSSWILDGMSLGKDQLSAKLAQQLAYLPQGPGKSGKAASDEAQGEIGLTAVNRVLDHGKVQSARAKGFFRKDAALMVLFVSDNQDYCSQASNSGSKYCAVKSPAQFDGNGVQVSSAVNEQISPELVLGKLQRLQGGRPLAVGGIVYANAQTAPQQSGKSVGHGYLELIQQGGGFVFDLAQGSLATELTALGSQVSTSVSYQSSFPLGSSNVDAATISVIVNGVVVDASYNDEGNTINLASALAPGSMLEINYCLESIIPADDSGNGSTDGEGNGTTNGDGSSSGDGDGSSSGDGTDDGSGAGDGSGDPDICFDLSCGFVPQV